MIISAVILVVCTVALLFAIYAYQIAFRHSARNDDIHYIPNTEQYQKYADETHRLVDEMFAIGYEEVFIESYDGLRLFGRYYHIQDGAPLQIQMHGYKGNAYRDFCGGHSLARKLGHNTLVVDQRTHGKSEGQAISFGINERKDCKSWVDYAVRRFGKEIPIILAGVSMGAATVLMASDMTMPENVVGIIADCPYSSPKDIITKVCTDMRLPGKAVYPIVTLAGILFGHFKLWESSAVDAVKNTKIPILILHGDDDRFVPCWMSQKIHDANPRKITLEIFPDAGHAMSYLVDPKRYEMAVRKFLTHTLENWCR